MVVVNSVIMLGIFQLQAVDKYKEKICHWKTVKDNEHLAKQKGMYVYKIETDGNHMIVP